MLRLLILLLLVTLPFAPSRAPAQTADPPDDMTVLGKYPELTRAIATKKYHLVLKHPAVEERLRALTGPHYDRIADLRNVTPIGYEPPFELVLQGDTADTAQQAEALREQVMIVVDWTTGTVRTALRGPKETLVFAWRPYLNELPRPLWLFVRRDTVLGVMDKAQTAPTEDWIRVLDYRDNPPQLWPQQ